MIRATWAICVIKDLGKALDPKRYDVARQHLNDAAAAILARDDMTEEEAAEVS